MIEDSQPVAFQLLSIPVADSPSSHQLALDMLRFFKIFFFERLFLIAFKKAIEKERCDCGCVIESWASLARFS